MQVNHILAEAHQHLRRGLPADAAVEVGLAGKVVLELPNVGDGIAEEDNAVFAGRGRLEGGVGVAVAGELAVVVSEDGNPPGPVLVEAGEAGGGNCGRGFLGRVLGRGLLGHGAESEDRDESKWGEQAAGNKLHVVPQGYERMGRPNEVR